ncbi:MAG TPA: hypothetical protein VMS31_10660, partial [Pyrinomonadaceae bacterium]|nr:hypothetical protein [Pyrinomonadaceae bacterium]
MKKLNSLHAVLCMAFVVAFLPTSALGQSAEDRNPLTVTSSGSSVRWDVAGQYSSLVMTVAGPDGRVFRKEFKGSSAEFSATDQNGDRLPDGQYNYELRMSPMLSPGVKEELVKLRKLEGAPEPALDKAKGSATSEALIQKTDTGDAIRQMRKQGMLPDELAAKSGSFSIQNGMIVVAGGSEGPQRRPATEESPRPSKRVPEVSQLQSSQPGGKIARVKQHHLLLNVVPDQVIPDDLIVQSSICVGFDCVNGESFGFDTIRLKENSTRIKFEDTSVGSFPSNDWQLTANDSASGGANKFSIEDITGSKVPFTITAGAATNSIFVDSTGRMGLRTATPVLDIHTNTSNTPALRLEQNNSGGFNAQTWDIGGNEANFFVRDVTGGSRLSFRIRPGAPTSSIDISANGNVGIGTASPASKLHTLVTSNNTVLPLSSEIGLVITNSDTTANNMAAISFGNAFPAGQGQIGVVNIGSSATAGGHLFFATRAAAGAFGERMRITDAGLVGIGTSAPTDT